MIFTNVLKKASIPENAKSWHLLVLQLKQNNKETRSNSFKN